MVSLMKSLDGFGRAIALVRSVIEPRDVQLIALSEIAQISGSSQLESGPLASRRVVFRSLLEAAESGWDRSAGQYRLRIVPDAIGNQHPQRRQCSSKRRN